MAAKFINSAREWDLTVAETNVLVALINYANKDSGLAWPAVSRLQWDTGMGKSTVIRCLRHLTELGILVKTREPTKTFPAAYRYNPDAYAPKKEPYRREYPERILSSTQSDSMSTHSGHDEYPERIPNRSEPLKEPDDENIVIKNCGDDGHEWVKVGRSVARCRHCRVKA